MDDGAGAERCAARLPGGGGGQGAARFVSGGRGGGQEVVISLPSGETAYQVPPTPCPLMSPAFLSPEKV